MFVYLSVQAILVGAWALLAPRSFYDDFPGGGRTWVAVDGPYNEHLIRDVGALNLALLVLLVVAARWPSRDLVLVAAAASVVWGAPHFVYHLVNTDGLATSDAVASVGSLAFGVLLPASVLLRPPPGPDQESVVRSDPSG